MRRIPFIILLGGCALALAAFARGSRADDAAPAHRAVVPLLVRTSPPALVNCTVSNVVDGDTIDVTGCADAGRVRLILIDTPEVFGGAECFSREASQYTKDHLLGKTVGLERDVSNTDSLGRFLRYVWVSGELFNEQIVRDGNAALAVYPPDTKYQQRIAAAEQDAKKAGRGLWPACGGAHALATATPPATATPTRTPTAMATVASPACESAAVTITGLQKSGTPEVVTVSGYGNMTGWYIISEAGNQRFDFPGELRLVGSVQVHSAVAQFPKTASTLWWTSASVWNNSSDDDALLYNCQGQLVSTFDDGM